MGVLTVWQSGVNEIIENSGDYDDVFKALTVAGPG
jgi:hypothetical protein